MGIQQEYINEALRRIATLEEHVDMLETPLIKRLAFYINGWPRLPVSASEQRWRFWHRWWGRRDGRRR